MALGLNYYPIKEIVVKAEYSKRFLKGLYNNEPSLNIGVAYEGFFQLGHRQMAQKEQADVDRLNERINDLQRQLNELRQQQNK